MFWSVRSSIARSFMLIAVFGLVERAAAVSFTYVGPNNGTWQTPGFWAPFVPPALFPPPNFGDSAVINGNTDVLLNGNVQGLVGLTVANQGDLLTNGSQLTVVNLAGTTQTHIVGTGTTGNNTELFVAPTGGANIGFLGDRVNLTNGGELDLVGGANVHITNRLNVDALSILTGDGAIVFTDTHNVAGRRLDLSGTIRPDANDTIALIAESGTIDLDGVVHNDNLVDLTNFGSRLLVDGPLTDSFTGRIEMGSGATLTMQEAWIFGPQPGNDPGPATIEIDPGAGNTATINGAQVTIGGAGASDARVDVLSGVGRVTANAFIQSNADIDVSSGAVLDFDGTVTFTGAASISGLGQFDPGSTNHVLGDVTIATSTIDFDAGDWSISEQLTLNVDSLDNVIGNAFGNLTPGNPSIDIHSQAIGANGRLTVNLPAGDAWRLASDAALNITAPGGGLAATNVAGSEVIVEGAISIDGNSRFTAPIDLEMTGAITVAADSSLTLVNDSQLSGGVVAGNGEIRSSTAVVSGHGQIAANVDFSGTSELWADNGTLRISGDIDDLGAVIGTADDDGVLLIETSSFDTALAGEVRLNGGAWIDGAALSFVQNTAAGQIRGHGTINVESINNYGLIAAAGGTLEIVDRLDWDGSELGVLGDEGSGILSAREGNLVISHTMYQGPSFVGTIATSGRHTFTYETGGSNDEILFDDAASGSKGGTDVGRLQMTGGTLTADIVTHKGQFSIQSAPSTIVADEIVFDNLGNSTIDSQLLLDTSGGLASAIEAGASFSGSGSLVNTSGSQLLIADEATVDVNVVNRGTLHVGYGPFVSEIAGDIEVRSFEQTGNGALEINLAGIGLEEFDRIDAADSALIDGILNVSLLGGFEPVLGNEFTILETAAGNISGIFNDVNTPVFNDLTLSINYTSNSVVLSVIDFNPADLNKDGFVDGLDLGILLGNWDGDVDPDEGELDGMPPVDGLDLGLLLGAWNPPPAPLAAMRAVPEPATLLLLLVSLAALPRRARRLT